MDTDLKSSMEALCQELGLTMSSAFTIFARKMTREQRIPFDVSVDPFYNEKNQARIRQAIENLNNGKGVEHKLIEVE
ncbi:MAG: type II toxin-antitoxin system RelB/DinJ family antitoxin [Acidaminococcaceae bacterium]|nr:type II toxin-antitoxin system RelB/DinJ family antitoxin [Acidaminococcaceae bacterium]